MRGSSLAVIGLVWLAVIGGVVAGCSGEPESPGRQKPEPTANGGEPSAPAGDGYCETSDDCTAPDGCTGGHRCGKCSAEGGECDRHDDCCDALGCSNHECTSQCLGDQLEVECSTSEDCCAGLECRSRFCRLGLCSRAGLACEFSSDCCDDNPCLGGKCRIPGPDGVACSSDTCEASRDCCDGGYCVEGSCSSTCQVDGAVCDSYDQCCEGSNCFSVGGEKFCSPGYCATEGKSCQKGCCDGLFCEGSCAKCKPAGTACSSRSGECCDGMVCFEQQCGACRQAQEGCEGNDDCCPGLSCDLIARICTGTPCSWTGEACAAGGGCCKYNECANGVCLLEDGVSCSNAKDCAGGACLGTCKSCAKSGESCGSDYDCCVGYECPSGKCQAKGSGCSPTSCSGCQYFGGETCCYACAGTTCKQSCSF